MHNFGPAVEGEGIVFGARRPGKGNFPMPNIYVREWIEFMQAQGIERVLCLLENRELGFYPEGLLEHYQAAFGAENVLHAPIKDVHLCDRELLLKTILPFLDESKDQGKKVVVHCVGGFGRTGHVLAAWLVHSRGVTAREAVRMVRSVGEAQRNAQEAVEGGNATVEELDALLETCR